MPITMPSTASSERSGCDFDRVVDQAPGVAGERRPVAQRAPDAATAPHSVLTAADHVDARRPLRRVEAGQHAGEPGAPPRSRPTVADRERQLGLRGGAHRRDQAEAPPAARRPRPSRATSVDSSSTSRTICAPRGAERAAHADLAGALGDRDERGVGDHDDRGQQRHAGRAAAAAAARSRSARLATKLARRLGAQDVERVVDPGAPAGAARASSAGSGPRPASCAAVSRAAREHLQRRRRAEDALEGRQRDPDVAVERGAGGGAEARLHADHVEAAAAEPQRRGRAGRGRGTARRRRRAPITATGRRPRLVSWREEAAAGDAQVADLGERGRRCR